MAIFRRIKDHATAARIEEEAFYEAALNEIESGGRRPGLWAKAIANADGDEHSAKALYLKLLVQKLKDEAHIDARIREEKARELADREEKKRQDEQRERRLKEQRQRYELQKAQEADSGPASLESPFALWGAIGLGISLLLIPLFLGQFERKAGQGSIQSEQEAQDVSSDSSFGAQMNEPAGASTDSSEYDQLVMHIEKLYPQLDPDHQDYNSALVDRVIERLQGYEFDGYASTGALLLAVDDVFGDLLLPKERQRISGASEAVSSPEGPDQPQSREPVCKFKGVMTDQDYRNCGIEPPG